MKLLVMIGLTIVSLGFGCSNDDGGDSGTVPPQDSDVPRYSDAPRDSDVPGSGGSGDANGNNLSYRFQVNGCDTGQRTFHTRDAYCKGLLDDKLNNSCARKLREAAHKKFCQEQND
jgi:hypothetical protein